jgi:hypothetical protein
MATYSYIHLDGQEGPRLLDLVGVEPDLNQSVEICGTLPPPAVADFALWERPRTREFQVGEGPMVAVAAKRYPEEDI